MKTGIIFDLDGTLLDTLDDLHNAVNHALETFGYPTRSREEIRRFVGNGAAQLLALSVPEGADSAPVLAVFQEYYRNHCSIHTGPYPGVVEVLQQLQQNYPMAVVSNKPDRAVKALCAELFPGIYARGEAADCPRKPHPAMVQQAMASIGVEHCIYIGDSEVDIATAKNAHVPCISVLWGFRTEEELTAAGATHFCSAPDQLAELIEMIEG